MLEIDFDQQAEEREIKIRRNIAEHQAKYGSGEGRHFETPQATPSELKWRHQHWWNTREKIRNHLRTGVLGMGLYDRFSNCGAMASVQWSKQNQTHRVSAVLCKSRHCEPCMRQKAGRIAGNLKEKMRKCPPGSFRFLTLTLRHDRDTRLKPQIARILKHFRALRALPVWKKTQRGGAFTLEIKHTPNGWHPHLHVIAEGNWMSRDALRDAWIKITGDSFQADIRRIPDADALAGYVVKYVTKSTSKEVWDNDAIAKEYLEGVKGTRTCATLGSWRGLKLTEPKIKVDDWEHVASLAQVMQDAKDRQPYALAIILSLRPPTEHTEHKKPNPSSRPKQSITG